MRHSLPHFVYREGRIAQNHGFSINTKKKHLAFRNTDLQTAYS
jgi:hypothetical protein